EAALDPLELRRVELRRGITRCLPLCFDQLAELLRAERLDENLDARLVNIVASALEVVDAQDCLEIAEQILLRQEFANHVPDHGGMTQAAAHEHLEADFPAFVAHQVQADVVNLRSGTILR